MIQFISVFVLDCILLSIIIEGYSPVNHRHHTEQSSLVEQVVTSTIQKQYQPNDQIKVSRRLVLTGISTIVPFLLNIPVSNANDEKTTPIPDAVDDDSYLWKGFDSNPKRISVQAGKIRHETGLTGNIVAEILVNPIKTTSTDQSTTKIPVLASFVSPWPLESRTVFDVECHNPNTGDGATVALTESTNGRTVSELPDSFFIESFISPRSKFASYGTPTNVRITRSYIDDKNYKVIDLGFFTVSEIPHRARIVATIPDGTSQAVMLIGTSSAIGWKNGSKQLIAQLVNSFLVLPASSSSTTYKNQYQTDYDNRAKQFNIATPDEVRAALNNNNYSTILLDVRTCEEINAYGRISKYDKTNTVVQTPATLNGCPGLSASSATVLGTDDTTVSIVIYCGSGKRADMARKILQNDHGYTGSIINAGSYDDIKTTLETL